MKGRFIAIALPDGQIRPPEMICCSLNPLNAKFIKWSNTLKQFVGKFPTNCLSVFDYFVGLAFKGLTHSTWLLHYLGNMSEENS